MPRTTAPAHATGAVDFVSLSEVSDDATFRLRAEGDVAVLAASIGRLGQLVPIELRPLPGLGPDDPPRYQVVAGFRRLAALKLLARERVLARVHATLDEEDAWAIALAQSLLGEPLKADELATLRARLPALLEGTWAAELLDDALECAGSAVPPGEAVDAEKADAEKAEERSEEEAEDAEGEATEEAMEEAETGGEAPGDAEEDPEEVTPEELALDLAVRMNEVSQDLALAFESWSDLPAEGRRMILEQAEYIAALVPYLRRSRR